MDPLVMKAVGEMIGSALPEVVNAVDKLLRVGIELWKDRGAEKRAAMAGYLNDIAGIIEKSVQAETVLDNESLCGRLKKYADDLDVRMKYGGMPDNERDTLAEALRTACDHWPKEDAFHQPGRPLSDYARIVLAREAGYFRGAARILDPNPS